MCPFKTRHELSEDYSNILGSFVYSLYKTRQFVNQLVICRHNITEILQGRHSFSRFTVTTTSRYLYTV